MKNQLTSGFFADLVKAKMTTPKSPRAEKRILCSPGLGLVAEANRVLARKPAKNPCSGCPAEGSPQSAPSIPPDALLVVVNEIPRADEVGKCRPRIVVETALSASSGVAARLGWACATRCAMRCGDQQRKEMVRRCAKHLLADLPPDVPVVAVGDDAVYALMESRDHPASYHRGLWRRSPSERRVFTLLSEEYERLVDDAARCARTLDSSSAELRRLVVVTDPNDHPDLMQWLANHVGPWAFDIESFDGAAFPSRDGVAVDACHPDYRVRGVAIAWSEDEGAWLELAPLGQDVWRPWLDPIFESPARKVAHNGHTDEDGLVYNGWVTRIANRGGDSMLEWIALSDGRHPGLGLDRLSVDVLGQDQWWNCFSKDRMRDAPIEDVARAAVFDAGMSLWLHVYARDRMEAGEYWDGN